MDAAVIRCPVLPGPGAAGKRPPGRSSAPLKSAISLRPDSLEAHFQLSKVYKGQHQEGLKDEQVAIVRQENAAVAEQTKAIVLGNKGTRAFSAGDMAKAVESYEEALKIDPKNAKLLYDLSLVYRRLGNKPSEKKALLEGENLDPSYPVVHNQLGMMYSEEGTAQKQKMNFSTRSKTTRTIQTH